MIETLAQSGADLRYPIGRFRKVALLTEAEREAAIDSIAATPIRLRAAILGLTPEQTVKVEQANDEVYLVELDRGAPPRLWKLVRDRNLGDL